MSMGHLLLCTMLTLRLQSSFLLLLFLLRFLLVLLLEGLKPVHRLLLLLRFLLFLRGALVLEALLQGASKLQQQKKSLRERESA